MKTEYNIKDTVWIHIGEHKLVKGRVVEIITLDHLNENHIKGKEHYIIELHTGIDDVYEVREWETISPDENGPINCFRNLGTEVRKLKKMGIKATQSDDTVDFMEEGEPTADQINAALERTEKLIKHPSMSPPTTPKPKRRNFKKKNIA